MPICCACFVIRKQNKSGPQEHQYQELNSAETPSNSHSEVRLGERVFVVPTNRLGELVGRSRRKSLKGWRDDEAINMQEEKEECGV